MKKEKNRYQSKRTGKFFYKYDVCDPFEIPTTSKGYFDVWEMVQDTKDYVNVYIVIGGRRLGKTYSCLKGVVEGHHRHLYVRRTKSDLDDTLSNQKNPYRAVNNELDTDIRVVPKGKDTNICRFEDDVEVENLGIASSVSTSGSVRGAYLEDIEYLIYDEFINLKPTNTIRKREGDLFFDLYDTANNDRDLRDKPPLKAILLSNANTTQDGIIRNLAIGQDLYEMIRDDKPYLYLEEKKLYIALLPNDNEITSKRKKSAIGTLIKNSSYSNMALANNFVDAYFGDIRDNIDYREYSSFLSMNDRLFLYRHKFDGSLVVSKRKAQVPKQWKYTNETVRDLKLNWGMFLNYYYQTSKIIYSDYDTKLLFMDWLLNK